MRSEEDFCGKADDGPGIVRYRPLTNPLPLTTPASAPTFFGEAQQQAPAFVKNPSSDKARDIQPLLFS